MKNKQENNKFIKVARIFEGEKKEFPAVTVSDLAL